MNQEQDRYKAMADSYVSGLSMQKVADNFGVDVYHVYKALAENNVPIRHRYYLTEEDKNDVKERYLRGESMKSIAATYGIVDHTVGDALRSMGITPDYRTRSYGADFDYFKDIDRVDKAYFLGFIVADGCIPIGTNRLVIDIHERDAYILERFMNVTHVTTKLKHAAKKACVMFHFGCKRWREDLAKYGVVPRKTFISYMPVLDDALMSHLIRGLIDGDGWVSVPSGRLGLCGTKQLVTAVRDYLVDHIGVNNNAISHSGPCKDLWQVQWGSKKDLQALSNFLYTDCGDYFLKRKYDALQTLLDANTEVSRQITQG